MVWCRWQKAETTLIKPEYFGENAKTCQSCLGIDVSGLYLYNLTRDQPTGCFVRRRSEAEFRAEHYYSTGYKATEWICWMGNELGVLFQHKFNGNERTVGGRKIPVDGYCKLNGCTEMVLQFSGCYYHSHMCSSTPIGFHDNVELDKQNKKNNYANLDYIKRLGYKVMHIWECEFDYMKHSDHRVKKFCEELDFVVDKRYQLTEQCIIDEVKSGKLYGMIECGVTVPERLRPIFEEFQPIVKHANLSLDHVGERMKSFAKRHKLLARPRKTLLCSYFADKILLGTPLLQWYLKHGVKVTKVYQTIQYKPIPCFQKFGEAVVEARRLGDSDSTKKIIADSCKLIGRRLTLSISLLQWRLSH